MDIRHDPCPTGAPEAHAHPRPHPHAPPRPFPQPHAPHHAPHHAPAPRLHATWARDADDVHQAQRLRHEVFAVEMGARLRPPPGTPPGLDVDAWDAHCEHLLVRTAATDVAPARVVGTYRVLTPDAARRAGGLYTETEFDLVRLRALRPRMVELGRSCVAADHRNGAAILMLWASLADFMQRNALDVMVGCASVPMPDGGHAAASVWRRLARDHLAPIEHQVRPRLPLPVDELDGCPQVELPALIKGYLHCGAKVLGPPAWDPDFGVADLPMMLRLNDMPGRYRRRFMA